MAVLGHDERPATRGGGAVLSRVVAALERQLAGMRARRHRDRLRAAREVEIAEPDREDGDQREAGDPACPEAFCDGLLAVTGERLLVQRGGFHGGSLVSVWTDFDPTETHTAAVVPMGGGQVSVGVA